MVPTPTYTLQEQYVEAVSDTVRIILKEQMKTRLDSVIVSLNSEEVLKRNKLDSIYTELSGISCTQPLVQKWKEAYMLYTKFLQTDTIAVTDRSALEALSTECSDRYGDAIHLARAMTNTYADTYYDIYDDCDLNNLLKRKKPVIQEITVYPNPSVGVFNLSLPETFSGFVEVSDMTGRVVLKRMIREGNLPTIDLTGQKGLLILRFEEVKGTSTLRKVIVIE